MKILDSDKLVCLGNKLIIEIENIKFLKGDINYTHIHFINGSYITVARTLKKVHEILNCSNSFFRINRTYVINIDKIQSYQNNLICIDEETFLKPSRRNTKAFRALIN